MAGVGGVKGAPEVAAAPRRIQPRSKRRRAAIIEAAFEEFSRNGYRATIASVAAAAGITDAGVLYHFPTKEDLLLAVIMHHDERGRWLLEDQDLRGLDIVRSMRRWGDWLEDNPNLMALHVRVSADNLVPGTAANDYFQQRYHSALALLVRLLTRARESDDVAGDLDPLYEARAFVALLDGLRLQWFFSGGVISIKAAVRTYVDNLLTRVQA